MGFLDAGATLSWSDVSKVAEYVRTHGIVQFLSIWEKRKSIRGDCLKFGDEVEYMLVHIDDESKTVRLSLRGGEVLHTLMEPELRGESDLTSLWRPEYGRYMIEGTPGKPFGDCISEFKRVERSMKLRRETVQKLLAREERLLSMTSFPRLGVDTFTHPPAAPGGPVAKSEFTPDEIMTEHRRFPTLTRNIRERRGSKVEIYVPLHMDTHTKLLPTPEHPEGEAKIYMDSMAFGMGMCCLQTTFQCMDIDEARKFYDQLAVFCPIMLALTAACPVFRGHLADIDARWSTISGSVDDRTPGERGMEPLGKGERRIYKSRYDSTSCYISNDPFTGFKPKYNDLELTINSDIYDQLIAGGVDNILARHLAHYFIRDPLVVYEGKVEIDDSARTDHFENIQSTNWQTMRFKPPPPDSKIGWRVEFRPMELQFTDFENAAHVVFIILLTRIINSFDLNFYIPISLVDENMRRAHLPNAIKTQRFHFRSDILREKSKLPPHMQHHGVHGEDDDDDESFIEMTIDELFNGSEKFTGLIQMMHVYLDSLSVDVECRAMVNRYLSFVGDRASGRLLSCATWIRKFVKEHPGYAQDSIVTDEIQYDLINKVLRISEGEEGAPELLGDYWPPNRAPPSPRSMGTIHEGKFMPRDGAS